MIRHQTQYLRVDEHFKSWNFEIQNPRTGKIFAFPLQSVSCSHISSLFALHTAPVQLCCSKSSFFLRTVCKPHTTSHVVHTILNVLHGFQKRRCYHSPESIFKQPKHWISTFLGYYLKNPSKYCYLCENDNCFWHTKSPFVFKTLRFSYVLFDNHASESSVCQNFKLKV